MAQPDTHIIGTVKRMFANDEKSVLLWQDISGNRQCEFTQEQHQAAYFEAVLANLALTI